MIKFQVFQDPDKNTFNLGCVWRPYGPHCRAMAIEYEQH